MIWNWEPQLITDRSDATQISLSVPTPTSSPSPKSRIAFWRRLRPCQPYPAPLPAQHPPAAPNLGATQPGHALDRAPSAGHTPLSPPPHPPAERPRPSAGWVVGWPSSPGRSARRLIQPGWPGREGRGRLLKRRSGWCDLATAGDCTLVL